MLLDAGAQTRPVQLHGRTCLHTVAVVPSWKATQLAALWKEFSQAALNAAADPGDAAEGPFAGIPPASAARVLARIADWHASLDRPVDFRGCAQALVDHGVAPDVTDPRGATPLHLAARVGNLDAVGWLLDHGAQVACRDPEGYSALEFAAEKGQAEAVRLLLARGADLHGRTRDRSDALHLAAQSGHAGTVRVLLEQGAAADSMDEFGATPLLKACSSGHVETARLLLEKGADVNAANADGKTPLHMLAKGVGNPATAELLLAAGAKVDARNRSGGTFYRQTPLIDAAELGRLALVKCLLAHGADVNARDDNGATALHWAALRDEQAVAEALLAAGGDPDATDGQGHSPLAIAQNHDDPDLLAMLRRAPTRPTNTPTAAAADLAALRAAAEGGDPEAQCRLAEHLISGPFAGRDPAQGVEWYTKAAHGGCPEALYALGLVYYQGKSVPQDLVKAYGHVLAAQKRLAADRREFDDGQAKAMRCIREKITREQKQAAEHEAERLLHEAETR